MKSGECGSNAEPSEVHFSGRNVKFLGHLIDRDGIRPDPEKIATIVKMQAPTNISELRHYMSMINQLGKFTHKITELTQPLRDLVSKRNSWIRGLNQKDSFQAIKEELVKPSVLALYNPVALTKISADASSFGLSALICQKDVTTDTWKPIAHASRSMSDTEKRYVQIEKEALATKWACNKFSEYVLGRKFLIETGHKPLVPLLSTKNLNSLPPRILCFRLRMMIFHYSIVYVPGKTLCTADTHSRSPVDLQQEPTIQEETEFFAEAIVTHLPATESQLNKY